MANNIIGLFTPIFLLCFINQAASDVYHITTANSSDHCTILQCLTLSEFIANSHHFLDSNTTLIFLHGRHNLETNLTVSNLENFSMNSLTTTAQIQCIKFLVTPNMYTSKTWSLWDVEAIKLKV